MLDHFWLWLVLAMSIEGNRASLSPRLLNLCGVQRGVEYLSRAPLGLHRFPSKMAQMLLSLPLCLSLERLRMSGHLCEQLLDAAFRAKKHAHAICDPSQARLLQAYAICPAAKRARLGSLFHPQRLASRANSPSGRVFCGRSPLLCVSAHCGCDGRLLMTDTPLFSGKPKKAPSLSVLERGDEGKCVVCMRPGPVCAWQ